MLGYESKRSLRRLGPILDKINIVFSICIVISGIFLVVNVEKYIFMFPVVFLLGALMNMTLSFKCYKMAEMGRMVVLAVAAVLLGVLSIVAYIVTV